MPPSPANGGLLRRAARAALVAAAFLLAGAVVSVGVAVGFGLWGTVDNYGGLGVAELVNAEFRPHPRYAPFFEAVDERFCREVWSPLPENGFLRHRTEWGPGSIDFTIVVDGSICCSRRTGWPLWALKDRNTPTTNAVVPHNDPIAWRPPSWLARGRYYHDVPTSGRRPPVPLRPIPLGLAANSAFYGAILFALYALLGPGRRALRRRRHLCPSCGYSREGLAHGGACPECGATTSKAPAP